MSDTNSDNALLEFYGKEYALRLQTLEEPRRLQMILRGNPIPRNAIVLDVGCGAGSLAAAIGTHVNEYHGVDFSQAFIDLARTAAQARAQPNCVFHCEDVVEFIDRRPASFDRLYALDISEHVPDDQWSLMVAAFKRALKPGGQAIVHTPNLDFFVERMKQHGILLKQFPEHIAVRTARGNAKFFKDVGFSSVHVRCCPHYNVLRHVHPLSYLPFIGQLFAARVLVTATN